LTYRDRGRRLAGRVKPYTPGISRAEAAAKVGIGVDQVGKMSSNENPIGPPPMAVAAITRFGDVLHEYPSPPAAELREAIGDYLSVDPDQVVLGTGSSALFHFIMVAFTEPGGEVVALDPSFPLYLETARVHGCEPVPVVLRPSEFRFEIERMAEAISPRTQVVFLTRPNNPTATLIPLDQVDEVRRLADEVGALVVADEAYLEYVDDYRDVTAVALIRGAEPRAPNLIVTRTFGKAFGLGNLRVGYAIGTRETAGQLRLANDKWSTGDVNRAAALAALRDTDHLEKTRQMAREGRRMLTDAFTEMGFDVVPNSQSVNIMVDVTRLRGPTVKKHNVGWMPPEFADAVFEKGHIMIRGDFSPTHVRISIARPELNARLVHTVQAIVAERLA
jgi:histidinol-phosphate aminotransferase